MKCLMKKILPILTIMLLLLTTVSHVAIARGYTLTVSADKGEYYPGETVTVSGYFLEDGVGVSGTSVCVSIKNPSGSEVFNICIGTGSDGSFSASYTAGSDIGRYSVKAEATEYGVQKTTSFKVVSTSIDVNANGPYKGVANKILHLSGSANGGKKPYSWAWTLGNGDHDFSEDPEYIYNLSGTYNVTLKVVDDGGYQGFDSTIAEIAEELIAEIDAPNAANNDTAINFYGSAQGGYPGYTWLWDFGDNENSTEQNPTHSYSTYQAYTITLTVTDEEGYSDEVSKEILITSNNQPDAPDINGPSSGRAGREYTYTFNSVDVDGDDVWYYIDWGDESYEEWIGPYDSGVDATFTHIWDEQASYTIQAKSKDAYDIESDWGSIEVSMPKRRTLSIQLFIERLIEQFPMLEYYFNS